MQLSLLTCWLLIPLTCLLKIVPTAQYMKMMIGDEMKYGMLVYRGKSAISFLLLVPQIDGMIKQILYDTIQSPILAIDKYFIIRT